MVVCVVVFYKVRRGRSDGEGYRAFLTIKALSVLKTLSYCFKSAQGLKVRKRPFLLSF